MPKLAAYTQQFPQIAQSPSSAAITFARSTGPAAAKPDLVIRSFAAREDNDNDPVGFAALNKAGVAVFDRLRVICWLPPMLPTCGCWAKRAQCHSAPLQAVHHVLSAAYGCDSAAAGGLSGPKPKVMLPASGGGTDTCCTTAAHGDLGDLLTFAGSIIIITPASRGVCD